MWIYYVLIVISLPTTCFGVLYKECNVINPLIFPTHLLVFIPILKRQCVVMKYLKCVPTCVTCSTNEEIRFFPALSSTVKLKRNICLLWLFFLFFWCVLDWSQKHHSCLCKYEVGNAWPFHFQCQAICFFFCIEASQSATIYN